MTPMLRQYLELKQQAGSALLLYRMGDFYELFFKDAQRAAPVLGIALTRRRHNDDVEAPMCGVPHHAFDGYLGKLLQAGFRVAVADQVEDPATAKGLVRREIVRTHTPGTVSSTELLEGDERCFLAAFGGDDESYALAWRWIASWEPILRKVYGPEPPSASQAGSAAGRPILPGPHTQSAVERELAGWGFWMAAGRLAMDRHKQRRPHSPPQLHTVDPSDSGSERFRSFGLRTRNLPT